MKAHMRATAVEVLRRDEIPHIYAEGRAKRIST